MMMSVFMDASFSISKFREIIDNWNETIFRFDRKDRSPATSSSVDFSPQLIKWG